MAFAVLFGCGGDTFTQNKPTQEDLRSGGAACDQSCQSISDLNAKYLALAGTVAQISAFASSDYDTCAATGNTADPLVNKICKIAQSATDTATVELKGELSTFVDGLTAQLQAVKDSIAASSTQEATDVATLNAQFAAINTQITTINTSLTTLNTQMTSANTAITALQTLTAAINGTLTGLLTTVEIGTENLAAGPVFETVERRADKTKIVGYVEALAAVQTLGANPLTATTGSTSLSVTLTAHGLVVGDTVVVAGVVAGKGYSTADVSGYFTVQTVTNANTFVISTNRIATASGAFGGSVVTSTKLLGRGLATVWVTASGADTAVRTTTLGTQRYNFIVNATGSICYDKAVAAQTFAVISAGGGNTTCK